MKGCAWFGELWKQVLLVLTPEESCVCFSLRGCWHKRGGSKAPLWEPTRKMVGNGVHRAWASCPEALALGFFPARVKAPSSGR